LQNMETHAVREAEFHSLLTHSTCHLLLLCFRIQRVRAQFTLNDLHCSCVLQVCLPGLPKATSSKVVNCKDQA
jgi:hypothetical protein